MSTPVLMPQLSDDAAGATLARWLKHEGDAVQAGEAIAEIETDKSTSELEAPCAGKMGRHLVNEGTADVAYGTTLAMLLHGDENEPAPAHAPKYREFAKTTVREALRSALFDAMSADDDVFLIGEQIGATGGTYRITEGLLKKFGGRRVIDAPVTHQATTGLALGAAMAGLRPVVEFMNWNFALQAMDQLIHTAAKTRYMSNGAITLPVTFRGPNGPSNRVAAQHGQDFAAWYAHVPGLKVVAPFDARDAYDLMTAAIRDDGPVLILEHEDLYGLSFDSSDADTDPSGLDQATILRQGNDISLITFSNLCTKALAAAEKLKEQGISAEIVNLRSLRPLDTETILNSASKCGRVLTIEAGWPQSGVGAEILALLAEKAFDKLTVPPARLTSADVPLPYAANLEALALPQTSDIVAKATALVQAKATVRENAPNLVLNQLPAKERAFRLELDLETIDHASGLAAILEGLGLNVDLIELAEGPVRRAGVSPSGEECAVVVAGAPHEVVDFKDGQPTSSNAVTVSIDIASSNVTPKDVAKALNRVFQKNG